MKPNASIRVRLPRLPMMRKIARSQAIGCTIGTLEGLMPGAGGTIASFIAYNEAKRWSKNPEKFGKGSEEGVAAPEASNNTVASTALIPLLSFGIPGSNSAAVLLGGLLIHGLLPGPRLFEQNTDVVHGLYVGSFVADMAQVIVGTLILPVCIWLVNRPRPYLAGFIYALILSGIYTVHIVAVRCRDRALRRDARLFPALFRLSRIACGAWRRAGRIDRIQLPALAGDFGWRQFDFSSGSDRRRFSRVGRADSGRLARQGMAQRAGRKRKAESRVTISGQIAEFADSIRAQELPRDVRNTVRNLLMDIAGLCLAAAAHGLCEGMRQFGCRRWAAPQRSVMPDRSVLMTRR